MANDSEWKQDDELCSTLQRLVMENYKRKEILCWLKRDFGQYCWSIRTLDRRLRFFEISYAKTQNLGGSLNLVIKDIVQQELEGPGKLLGYRAMHTKIKVIHMIPATRKAVYDAMKDLAPEILNERRPCIKKKRRTGHYISPGPNFLHSLDGHDKLMGYQNWTFPIAIYGALDSCTRKVVWIKVWPSNHDPKMIAKFYLEYLVASKLMPCMVRIDRGTETGDLAAIHSYLCASENFTDVVPEDALDHVIYGPSTSNQVRTGNSIYLLLNS